MGIASRTPNTHTKTGRATTPPPNPATPAMVKPMVVATTTAIILRTSSNYHLPKKSPVLQRRTGGHITDNRRISSRGFQWTDFG